jgi:adenine deaminase
MMNFPGVLASDEDVMRKIYDARRLRRSVDGHAPGLSGKALDAYISAGIGSDHECTTAEEAIEKIRKGQTIMIRQGTAARNLDALLPLFDEPYCHRCILVTDDLHPADIMSEGHIDNIVRKAAAKGKSAITGIQMATIGAARYFGLGHVGAIAPGYRADILVLDDLDSVDVRDVYSSGVKVVDNKEVLDFEAPKVNEYLEERVRSSFHLPPLRAMDFRIEEKSNRCRVIGVLGGGLLTEEKIMDIVWGETGGVDTERDILKVAVIERYNNTGHIGLGFINGIGLKRGAIASSVSHDSHNIIVIGTNDTDMAIAANRIREVGGNVVVCDGKVISEMSLSIGGLMSDASAAEVARQNKAVREAVKELGVCEGVEPFMNMAFVSLPVIPSLKISTCGLIDVNKQEKVPLCL